MQLGSRPVNKGGSCPSERNWGASRAPGEPSRHEQEYVRKCARPGQGKALRAHLRAEQSKGGPRLHSACLRASDPLKRASRDGGMTKGPTPKRLALVGSALAEQAFANHLTEPEPQQEQEQAVQEQGSHSNASPVQQALTIRECLHSSFDTFHERYHRHTCNPDARDNSKRARTEVRALMLDTYLASLPDSPVHHSLECPPIDRTKEND